MINWSMIKTAFKWMTFAVWIILIPFSISYCRLKNEINKTQHESSILRRQNQVLEMSVKLQNQQIEYWETQTRQATARFEQAATAAEIQNRHLRSVADTLKNAVGRSCNDAMKLVDEVIINTRS